MKVAILGSGFGLYGYLPAIMIGCGEQVVLPLRYRSRLEGRADVRHLAEAVQWVVDDERALEHADAVVISRRPADQVDLVRRNLGRENIGKWLLEKPLAPSPGEALRMIGELEASGKRFCIGYTLLQTPWAEGLLRWLRLANPDGALSIDWRFKAHHYATGANNWKRYVSEGGGALRFYGIHVLGLLAEAGYGAVRESSVASGEADEAETWQAVFEAPRLPRCHVQVGSNDATTCFGVRGRGAGLQDYTVALGDPFDEAERDGVHDRRVAILTQLCKDWLYGASIAHRRDRQSIELWASVELKAAAASGARPGD